MGATPLFFETPAKFRAWLKRNASTATELLVGFYKRDCGRPSITWEESVDEALCFGWIDGVRTRIDEVAYKIRFSPRKKDSRWSAINIDKVNALQAKSRMTAAGLAAFERRKEDKSRTYSYEQTRRSKLDAESEALFRAKKAAWRFFEAQPPGYRRTATWYVVSAKKPETRKTRLARLIAASARGERL